MFVHNRFTIEINRFMHTLCTFLTHTTYGAIAISQCRTRRIEDDGRLQNCQKIYKDGSQLNNGIKDDRITETTCTSAPE